MKNVDVSKSVMNKVVRFERRRTLWWFGKFITTVAVLFITLLLLILLTVRVLSNRQAWDLLTLFTQDPEIISSYWQDTLWVFWEEAPHRVMFMSVIILIVIIGVIAITGRKRKILHKKLNEIDKYK